MDLRDIICPPRDSLIPPTHSTGEPSPVRSVQEREWGIPISGIVPPNINWKLREQGVRPIPRSPLFPDGRSQIEERDSVLDAVRQITGASKEIPRQEKVSFDTPEYDWDTRYDGIQGFPSHFKNRVSEPSTPQRGQSPKGGPRTPPEPQRYYKQLKVYDETPSGRPLPTLQQIRQANLQKIFEEEGVDTPCDICGDPQHDYSIALGKVILSPKMFGKTQGWREVLKNNVQIVMSLTREFACVPGVNSPTTLLRTVWHILLILVCRPDSLKEKK